MFFNSFFGGTGKRDNGNFLQKRVPDTVTFPCSTIGYRSKTIPKNVNRLRPGRFSISLCTVRNRKNNLKKNIFFQAILML